METSARGRDAASKQKAIRPQSRPRGFDEHSSLPRPQPPSTRSRSRFQASATRAKPSFPRRNSSVAVANARSSLQPFPSASKDLVPSRSKLQVPSVEGPRISSQTHQPLNFPSSSTCRAASAAEAAIVASTDPLAPRGRSRSLSKKRLPHFSRDGVRTARLSSLEGLAEFPSGSHSNAAARVSTAVETRPHKRSRTSSATVLHTQDCDILPATSLPVFQGTSHRSSLATMDPDDSLEGSSMRNADRTEQQQNENNTHNSLIGDRPPTNSLQGLLRRLGADLNDMFPRNVSTSHSRLQQLRQALSAPENEGHQLQALTELCEFLSVGTEESLVSFSVNMYVPSLVDILRTGSDTEIKILAARALTHMMEALPSSSSSIASHGAAGPLCQNLLAIEYIDLAEQSLYALRKLSVDYPQTIVTSNGFRAVLSYIDFFSIGLQRVAAETASNLCRLSRTEMMSMVVEVLPIMTGLIDSEDQRIRELMILGFRRLAESLRNKPAELEVLSGKEYGVVTKILGLLVPSSAPPLATSSHSSAFQFLAIIARGSADIGLQIISTQELVIRLVTSLRSRPSTDAVECLTLADSLLPSIPELERNPTPTRSRRRHLGNSSVTVFAAVDWKRREQLMRNPAALVSFGLSLFPTFMKFYCSAADDTARKSILNILSKFISVSSANVLREVLQVPFVTSSGGIRDWDAIQFSPFIAGLLRANSSQGETVVGLAMADAVLRNLSSIKESFIREGVVHEFMRIAKWTERNAEFHGVQCEQSESLSNNSVTGQIVGSLSPERNSFQTGNERAVVVQQYQTSGSVWSMLAAFQRAIQPTGVGGGVEHHDNRFTARGADLQFTNSQYQEVIPRVARLMLAKHFGAHPNGVMDTSALRNSRLEKLRHLSRILRETPTRASLYEAASTQALSDLINLLTSPGNLSVFEVSESGIIRALSDYLTKSGVAERPKRISTLVRILDLEASREALSSLVYLSLGALSFEERLSAKCDEVPRCDLHMAVSSGLRQLAQPFKLRLMKSSADPGDSLRDYSQHMVLIEPLASMTSIEEFLWPKVGVPDRTTISKLKSNGTGERRVGSGRAQRYVGGDERERESVGLAGLSGHPIASDDENDRVEDRGVFAVDEVPGDSSQRARTDDAERELDISDEDNSSAEGDVIGQGLRNGDGNGQSHLEVDVDELASSLPPLELDHEVLDHVPSRVVSELPKSEQRRTSGAGSSSRRGGESINNFRSYAAALVANVPTPSGQVSEPGNPPPSRSRGYATSHHGFLSPSMAMAPRLSFSCNGRNIPRNSSILSAVILCSPGGRKIGQHLWSQVHTLVYDVAKPPEGQGGCGGEPSNFATSSSCHGMDGNICRRDRSGGLRRSQRLENRKKLKLGAASRTDCPHSEANSARQSPTAVPNASLPTPLPLSMSDVPTQIVCIMEVLNHLNWIYVRWKGSNGSLKWNSFSKQRSTDDGEVRFHSNELSAKLIRQISNPLILCGNAVPSWCFSIIRGASFLIPFETRKIFFQSTSLGTARALHLLQGRVDNLENGPSFQRRSQNQGEYETRIGRIRRQKVRIHRDRILESAITIMNLYAKHSTMLEVQFFHEVGTGLGPTLEFYTLASREVQREDLDLWRCVPRHVSRSAGSSGDQFSSRFMKKSLSVGEERVPFSTGVKRRKKLHSQTTSFSRESALLESNNYEGEYVVPTGNGLFPSCISKGSTGLAGDSLGKSAALFAFVGRLIGKALLDCRLLDLRFSRALSSLMLAYCQVYDERSESSHSRGGPADIEGTTPGFWRDNVDYATRLRVWEIFTSGTSTMELLEDVDPQLAGSLRVITDLIHSGRSDSVESLCLTFVLPGDENYELIENGSNMEVTGENAEDFVRCVQYHVLFEGVQQQVEALLRGMNDIIDIRGLLSFHGGEIEMLLCGPSFEKWTVDFLVRTTKCDHGYSHESPVVLNFLQVLSEMTQAQQQRFVMFATGSPALPVGGLSNLRPPLTIVRRTPEEGRSPDESLPTVMTCTNYFKLPDYSSIDVTRKQVTYAILEGQGAFHLS